VARTRSLTELAKALPDAERRQLLERITRALSLHDQSQRSVYRGSVEADERDQLIHEELERLSPWDRFLFWLKRVSSSRSEEEAYVAFKLDQLKRRILSARHTLVRFDRRTIEPDVARMTIELYRAVIGLVPFFRSIWEEPQRLQWMITYLLERKVPNARTTLEHFISIEEMQDIYLATGSKAAIRKAVQKRTDQYLDSIPDELFEQLTEGILPLYLLKYICLYPYRDFFNYFKVSAEDLDADGEPQLQPAPATAMLENLEQLYFGLYAASRITADARIHPELLQAYDAYNSNEGEAAGTEPETARHYNSGMAELLQTAQRVSQSLPLADIIRYFRNDPYHKLMVYLPRLKLLDFYASHLRVRIFASIDKVFPQVRLGIVKKISSEVFDTEPPPLEYYRSTLVTAGRKLEAPPFRHFRALRSIRHFLRTIYRDDIAKTVRLLARIIPVRYREISSDLTLRANGLEEIAERISRFDFSFSPESDEGKSFFRVRYTGEKDLSQARTYRTIIVQKNREAREIVNDTLEHLQGLEQVFRRLHDLGSRTISERFEALTFAAKRSRLDAVVKRHADTLGELRQMLNQLVEIEES
jgi:hypothetical protein